MSQKLKLEEAVLISSILGKLTFTDYKLLSEWVGILVYTYPKDRVVNNEFISALCKLLSSKEGKITSSLYFQLWNYSTWIEQFTLEAQQRMLDWILEYLEYKAI